MSARSPGNFNRFHLVVATTESFPILHPDDANRDMPEKQRYD